ncbi:hypothetical protein GCM10010191_71800 [Actinomadura vinacea]|uniref:DUF5753 domain-containing protein n=1 Tax=Actinomadura vinacea TaxID=115336 RepID=A0ABN3K2F9_9ACTN
MVRGGPLELEPDEIERRVEVRMNRQRLLTGPDRPQLWAIIDEAALRRVMGGPEVRRAQLRHLERSAHGRTTLQILPFGIGPHPGTTGPFIVLGFPEATEVDVVYMETIGREPVGGQARGGEAVQDRLRSPARSAQMTREIC